MEHAPAAPDVQQTAWHALTAEEAMARRDSRPAGLTTAEAGRRLRAHGPNRLHQESPPGLGIIFLRQFQSPLIYVLAAAGVVSVVIGEITDAAFIFGVLVLNAVIGTSQEWRAEKSNLALQALLRVRATVVREGETVELDAEEVVPGDVVWLEPGARVPVDARLFWEHGLEVDESLLTGESLPVSKAVDWIGEESTPLADRRNMAFAGSTVARGRARAVAVETGMHTAVGRLALDVSSSRGGRPPLVVRLERFTRAIAIAVLFAALVVGVVGVAVRGQTVSEMFLFAVAMAVSAIPEGLPVALTVALAIATTRMARRGVIVRRLAAVEGLGSCTLIATDKTGTLTCNELTVRAAHTIDGAMLSVTGEGYTPEGGKVMHGYRVLEPGGMPAADALARVAVLCNEAHLHRSDGEWTWHGDPTDVALLVFGEKLGSSRDRAVERWPEITQIPFEPERKYAATFHRDADRTYVAAKGAPERILTMCAWPEQGASLEGSLREVASEMAAEGYRVLALAEGWLEEPPSDEHLPPEPEELTFVGFLGMIDPLRSGAREAVADCRRAGIEVAMVTGDHPVTALAIARDLGLADHPSEVTVGASLEGADEAKLRAAIRGARVFARMSPHQKLEIVSAAQLEGMFVAVTGDGVNDAPALRAANIGVAMGRSGTDVAREAAELVVSDDNFATIVAGVEEGRVAYDNVRKVIYLLISTGAAEIVLIGLSLVAGMPLPLLPVQLLWLNLVTNGIQDVALAFEPKEADVLLRPPRPPTQRIFDRLMLERTFVGAAVMGAVAFAAFEWMLGAGMSEADARNHLLLLMVLFEILHIGNCRSETRSAFALSPLRSPVLLGGTLTAFGIHVATMYSPLGTEILGIAPVDLEAWAVLLLMALTVTVAMEAHKASWAWRRHRRDRHRAPQG